MTMPRELDMDGAGVVDLAKGLEDRSEIHLAFPEHQVFMYSAAHVLDVHIP